MRAGRSWRHGLLQRAKHKGKTGYKGLFRENPGALVYPDWPCMDVIITEDRTYGYVLQHLRA